MQPPSVATHSAAWATGIRGVAVPTNCCSHQVDQMNVKWGRPARAVLSCSRHGGHLLASFNSHIRPKRSPLTWCIAKRGTVPQIRRPSVDLRVRVSTFTKKSCAFAKATTADVSSQENEKKCAEVVSQKNPNFAHSSGDTKTPNTNCQQRGTRNIIQISSAWHPR